MDWDEDDEEPQNEPGTSSNSQPAVKVLPLHQAPATSSQGPTVLDNTAYEDTVGIAMKIVHKVRVPKGFCTIQISTFSLLMSVGHWHQRHKYVAAAGAFCFATTENGAQEDTCNLTTMPCVQRSLYLNERTNNFGNMKVDVPKGVDGRTRAKMNSRARMEASAQEVRGYYKTVCWSKTPRVQILGRHWSFDLVDLRKVKPRNYDTERWVLTIKTDKQGNLFMAKVRWVLRGFQDKQEAYQQTDSLGFHITQTSDELSQMASKSWI